LKFKNIFTEYDESLEKTLEIDPMGLSVIWTHFGQEIFHNKISSVALDVRSFNINLFNHFIIKNLMQNSSNTLQNQFEKNPKTTIEKLLIILENMLIWSWYKDSKDGNEWGDFKNGLLGTSKALSKWEKGEINLDVTEKIPELELLKRQKTLGVNGRYKGSFINMGFFTANYDNDTYFPKELFDDVKIIVEENEDFNALYKSLLEFFSHETLEANLIDTNLFTAVFKENQEIVKSTKRFWLKKLGFTKKEEENNEAKNIYDSIDIDSIYSWDEVKNIFYIANQKQSSSKLQIISQIEPKLSYLDSVLNYLIFLDTQEIKKVKKLKYFHKLKSLHFEDEEDSITKECGAKKRLSALNKVDSIEELINYHTTIMQDRGHQPWIKIDDEGIIRTTIKKVSGKEELEERLDQELSEISWIHDYYISSVLNIKKGLSQ